MDTPSPPVYPGPHPMTAPPKRSRGWMFFALILLVFLGLMLARDFFQFLLAFTGTGGLQRGRQALQEVLVEDNASRHKIAVVSVEGFISGGLLNGHRDMVSTVQDQLRIAAADEAVKAVLLKVDSPGGEVLAADEIYRAIVDFQRTARKPVVASMGTLAASGGYYVSAPCQWIVANELTLTGSIGVIMNGWNYRGLMDKVGVQPKTFKSGRFKDMLSGSRREEDIPPEERQMVQGLIDQTYHRFTNIVYLGRQAAQKKNLNNGRSLQPEWSQYVDGRVFTGRDAFTAGFVDELGSLDTAVDRIKVLANIPDANLVRYDYPFDLSSVLRWFVKSDTPAIKVDLGLNLPKLRTGCLYFLSPLHGE